MHDLHIVLNYQTISDCCAAGSICVVELSETVLHRIYECIHLRGEEIGLAASTVSCRWQWLVNINFVSMLTCGCLQVISGWKLW